VNEAKKSGEVEKISSFKRNMAKFLAKNRDIRQNRKARILSRQSLKKGHGEKRMNAYKEFYPKHCTKITPAQKMFYGH
jgi:hypothetical protein